MTKSKTFIILYRANNISPSKKGELRGVAQMVARMVRDHEVVGSNPVTPTKKKKQADTPVFFFVAVLGIMNEILSAKFQFTNQRVAFVPKDLHKAQIRLPVTFLFSINEVHAFALANARER